MYVCTYETITPISIITLSPPKSFLMLFHNPHFITMTHDLFYGAVGELTFFRAVMSKQWPVGRIWPNQPSVSVNRIWLEHGHTRCLHTVCVGCVITAQILTLHKLALAFYFLPVPLHFLWEYISPCDPNSDIWIGRPLSSLSRVFCSLAHSFQVARDMRGLIGDS